MRRNRLAAVFVLLLAAVMLLTGCAASASGNRDRNTAKPDAAATPGPMDEAQRIADYLFENGRLPDCFIRKQEFIAPLVRSVGYDHAPKGTIVPIRRQADLVVEIALTGNRKARPRLWAGHEPSLRRTRRTLCAATETLPSVSRLLFPIAYSTIA